MRGEFSDASGFGEGGTAVTSTFSPCGLHAMLSPTTFVSETFLKVLGFTAHTHNFARPLPSLSEKKARYCPSGDQVGSQLSPAPVVNCVGSPVSRSKINICPPIPHHGIPFS